MELLSLERLMITRYERVIFVLALVAVAVSCDKLPLLAPTGSVITLFAGSSTVQANGSTTITATVLESSGTPVQNGTLVSFTTTVGQITPVDARTSNGKVTVTFSGAGQSGEATIQATSGGAKAASTTPLTIKVGGAAASRVQLTANPGTVPSSGGSTEITAGVTDASGNPLALVQVNFSTTVGTLSSATASTDAAGQAKTTLTTNREAVVTATAGAATTGTGTTATGTVTIKVNTLPTLSITLPTTAVFDDQPATFTFTVTPPTGGTGLQNVTITWGDGNSQNLGTVSGAVAVPHTYRSDGTFILTATGTDSTGERVTASTSVVVQSKGPIDVTFTDAQSAAGAPVTYTAVTESGVTNATYQWTFGDGNSTTVTGKTTSHGYAAPGTYHVQLTVTTADGRSGNTSRDIKVN
jgi:adhesin/invasin